MKYIVIVLSLLSFNASASDFSFSTTYWFNKIDAHCSQGLCKVFVNDTYMDTYFYSMKNNIAYSNIKGLSISYNIETQELKY